MANRVGYISINILYIVHNLPVLKRRPGHLIRAESNLRLRLWRPSSADYMKRYAARGIVYISVYCRQALLKDLSYMARVDEVLLYLDSRFFAYFKIGLAT
jgi:hypothetical protein